MTPATTTIAAGAGIPMASKNTTELPYVRNSLSAGFATRAATTRRTPSSAQSGVDRRIDRTRFVYVASIVAGVRGPE
jgi:hypothetical protein